MATYKIAILIADASPKFFVEAFWAILPEEFNCSSHTEQRMREIFTENYITQNYKGIHNEDLLYQLNPVVKGEGSIVIFEYKK